MQNELYASRNDHKSTFPSFNPLTHIPPSYDLYGHEIPPNPNKIKYNILSEKEIQKTPWDTSNPLTQSTPMTRTRLLELRKKENIPDISYDLDGDGYVGNRDYVLSKRFDIDGDGKLNPTEKKKALEAINNGIEKEYVWNLENRIPDTYITKKRKNNRRRKFCPFARKLPKAPDKFSSTEKWYLYLE